MIFFPNAKINLGLRVIEKRKDGYHSIETIFIPINLCDVLEFVEISDGESKLDVSGIIIDGKPEDNLILKAWQIMNRNHTIPKIHAHLHKVIPIGAGLGGGSANAAFMLKKLNDFFSCGCSVELLQKYASELGSDCAFFIRNIPSVGTGRGEILEPADLRLSGYEIVLVNPGIHVGTRDAYAGITPSRPSDSLKELITLPVEQWQNSIMNVFETSVFKVYPAIAELKQKLIDSGASYCAMSGSGSTVYGIFREGELDQKQLSFENSFVYRGRMIT